MPKVLLFVDNSNIFISAKEEALRREGRQAKDQVRLQFDLLLQLALAGRFPAVRGESTRDGQIGQGTAA